MNYAMYQHTFFHIFVRLKQSENDNDPLEIRFKIYVPQIVNILELSALSCVHKDIVYKGSDGIATLVYNQTGETSVTNDAVKIANYCMSIFPKETNIRFLVNVNNRNIHSAKAVYFSSSNKGSRRGESYNFGFRNSNPYGGYIYVYLGAFDEFIKNGVEYINNNKSPAISFPLSLENLLYYTSITISHEVAHSIGLVDPEYFYSSNNGNEQRYHNQDNRNDYIMNKGGLYHLKNRTDFNAETRWMRVNANYIRFTLPIPQEIQE